MEVPLNTEDYIFPQMVYQIIPKDDFEYLPLNEVAFDFKLISRFESTFYNLSPDQNFLFKFSNEYKAMRIFCKDKDTRQDYFVGVIMPLKWKNC